MRLHHETELYKELVKRTADALNIQEPFVEKDYYAISVLKELVSRDDKLVFKGGTSLSVCHHVIHRFSEDIDISYCEETISRRVRKRIKKDFIDSIEAVGLHVENLDNIRSRRVFNRYVCPFPQLYIGVDPTVLVEWATQTPAFPIETRQAQTLIGQYLTQVKAEEVVARFDLGPFDVKTLVKERTAVDKLFALADYYLSGKLRRQSRHLYDLHQLLPLLKLDADFIALLDRVRSYRIPLGPSLSAREGVVLSSLLEAALEQDTFKDDYQKLTYPLLYDHVTYETAKVSLRRYVDFLRESSR